MNMNKLVLFLTVPCFALNFNLRKSKQTLIIFNLYTFFYKKNIYKKVSLKNPEMLRKC